MLMVRSQCYPLKRICTALYAVQLMLTFCLKCFDAVGWAAGRASGLYKTEWWGAGMVIYLEWGADLHMAQLMPLPLTVSCFSKILIGFTFPVPAVCVQVLAKCVVWFLRYRKMCAWMQVSGSPELSPITVDCPTSSTQLQLPVRLQTITGDIQLTARLELNVSLCSLHYFTHTHTPV